MSLQAIETWIRRPAGLATYLWGLVSLAPMSSPSSGFGARLAPPGVPGRWRHLASDRGRRGLWSFPAGSLHPQPV